MTFLTKIKKNRCWYWGSTAMKYTRDKTYINNPKVNRGCPPLTVNRLCTNFTSILNTIYSTKGLPYWGIQHYDGKIFTNNNCVVGKWCLQMIDVYCTGIKLFVLLMSVLRLSSNLLSNPVLYNVELFMYSASRCLSPIQFVSLYISIIRKYLYTRWCACYPLEVFFWALIQYKDLIQPV